MELKVNKASRLKGAVRVPGDKSISHRALVLGALASGQTRIANMLTSADCLSTLSCLHQLAVPIAITEKGIIVDGRGPTGLTEPVDVLNVGNSGTTLRVLPGVLAGQRFFSVLTGDESIRRRPVDRVVKPLRQMGAQIAARAGHTLAPICILGSRLHGAEYEMPVASAQVKTALMVAGLLAEGETVVREKTVSRDHTERLMVHFGIDCDRQVTDGQATVKVKGGQTFAGREVTVPGDLSSAAFLMAAGLLVPGAEIELIDVGINPTRTGILDVLAKMGAWVEILDQKVVGGEPVGRLKVRREPLKAVRIGGELIPRLIDELPVIALLATQAEGVTEISDAAELRLKETDRIKYLASELKLLGAKITEKPDGFVIEGPTPLTGSMVDSYGDHRLAMMLIVAGLIAEGTTVIQRAECINVSFPGFEQTLMSLVG